MVTRTGITARVCDILGITKHRIWLYMVAQVKEQVEHRELLRRELNITEEEMCSVRLADGGCSDSQCVYHPTAADSVSYLRTLTVRTSEQQIFYRLTRW